MSTVADQLREAREAKKLTIEHLADITKIRTDHLRALEAGDYDVFSAPVYIRGFVRSLATLLKLDVPRIMASLDAELAQTRKFAEPPPLTGSSRGVLDFIMLQLSKVDWRKALVGIIVLVILTGAAVGVLVWRKSRTSDPLRDRPPLKYQSPGEKLPVPGAPPPAPTPVHGR